MKLKIKKLDAASILPEYQHGSQEDAGLDLHSIEAKTLQPGEYKLFKTGLALEIPSGYMGKICPRSGLAFRQGVTVLNAEGTIDPAYRGELGVVLINHGSEPYQVDQGDRIAQLIIEEYEKIEWEEVTDLTATQRGTGGYGHTGV